jgi:protein-S-isoprenylcysteine O-methyltransferase Ste14
MQLLLNLDSRCHIYRRAQQVNGFILILLIHQGLFQGIFLAKNIVLRHKLGKPIRGGNREANLSIGFFALFIGVSFLIALFEAPFAGIQQPGTALACALLVVNLLIAGASLIDLGDSWRVGVLEDQQTDLIEAGIYRYSRNPYFLSYLIMFTAYTILLQSIILLILSLVGFALIHGMVLREEKYLSRVHGRKYRQYQHKVPRYILFRGTGVAKDLM